MRYSQIIQKIAKKYDLDETIVIDIYNSYWKFIKTTIENLPLKEIRTQEDFNKLKTNFNLMSLGKLSCTIDKWNKLKREESYLKQQKINKNNYD